MKTILVMGLLALSTTAFSSVVKSSDSKNSCTLYRMISEGSKPQQANESLVTSKEVYGFSLENLEVDFNNREAKAQIIMNIVLGFNKPLVNGKSSIEESNSQFTMLINQVNRDLSLLESVCIDRDNKIVYGKVRQTSK